VNDLLSQLVVYTSAGALGGLLLGWWLGRWSSRHRLAEALEDWQARLDASEIGREESATEVQRLAAQLAELKIEIEEAHDRQQLTASALDDTEQALAEQREIAEASAPVIAGYQEEIARVQDEAKASGHEVAATREELDVLTRQLESSRNRQRELETQVNDTRSRVETHGRRDAALRAELEGLRQVEADGQRWAQANASYEEELEFLKVQLASEAKHGDELEVEVARLREQVEAMAAEVSAETAADTSTLEARVEALQLQLERATERSDALEAAIRTDSQELTTVREDLGERDQRIEALEERLADDADAEVEIRSLRAELADSLRQNDELAARARGAEAAREEAAKELADQRAAPLINVDKLATARETPPEPVAFPTREGELEVMETARTASDDLKQIRGIGRVLESTLNDLGVHRLRQIAEWTQADIEAIESRLSTFPGRIGRDGWVAQATQLIADRSVAE